MLYKDYLKAAKKNLDACKGLLREYEYGIEEGNASEQEQYDVFLSIYYLAGYIIESLTTYLIYSLGRWNPPGLNKDIKGAYDVVFSGKYGIDFFKDGVRNNCQRLGNSNCIQGHDFQNNIKDVIQRYFVQENDFILDMPYFSPDKSLIDNRTRELIDNWNPEFRYFYKDYKDAKPVIKDLKIQEISKLIKACEKMYNIAKEM